MTELAAAIGVPPANLVGAVSRFNELVAGGVDHDFGRGDEAYDRTFTGGASPLVPIGRPPYHAAAFGLSDLGTKGGLRTDCAARVLDTAGRPIPGLYAAGNTMAAVSGTAYPGGGNPIGASCCSATSRRCTWLIVRPPDTEASDGHHSAHAFLITTTLCRPSRADHRRRLRHRAGHRPAHPRRGWPGGRRRHQRVRDWRTP